MPHRTPAALERVRVPLARLLLLARPASRIGLSLTPKSHPYRPFAESTFDDLDEFTATALRPRDASGIPAVRLPRARKRTLALAATAYLSVAQLVPMMPAVVLYHGPGKIHSDELGLTTERVVAPRLRIFVTPHPSELQRVEP